MDASDRLKAVVSASVGLLESRNLEQLRRAVEEAQGTGAWQQLAAARTAAAVDGAAGIHTAARTTGLYLNQLCGRAIAKVRAFEVAQADDGAINSARDVSTVIPRGWPGVRNCRAH